MQKENLYPLTQIKESESGIIAHFEEDQMDSNMLRDFWDHGFLPGTKVEILGIYSSQKKILLLLEGAVKIAIPMDLADKVYLKNAS